MACELQLLQRHLLSLLSISVQGVDNKQAVDVIRGHEELRR